MRNNATHNWLFVQPYFEKHTGVSDLLQGLFVENGVWSDTVKDIAWSHTLGASKKKKTFPPQNWTSSYALPKNMKRSLINIGSIVIGKMKPK